MSRAWVILKRIGRVLKFLLFCVILTVCILLLWRVFSTGIPKEIEHLEPTAALRSAYAQQGEKLYVFEQGYDEITRAERNAGYFGVAEALFIPDANQAQIVFRYNNSTIKAVAEDYSLPSIPDRETELFDVTLVVYVDLTPDNEEDNYSTGSDTVKAIRIKPTSGKRADSTLYNFYRYVFDFGSAEEPVDLKALLEEGSIIAIHSQIYYKDDLDYEKTPYGALCLYDLRRDNNAVKFSSQEKKALGE